MIVDRIKSVARSYKEKPAIIFDGQELTYVELVERAEKLASLLPNRTNIGLCINDPLLFSVCYLAVIMQGNTLTLITNKANSSILDDLHKSTDCCLIITDRTDLLHNPYVALIDTSYFITINKRENYPLHRDSHIILFTSGSTSRPKPTVFEQQALLWNAQAHNQHMGIRDVDNALIILPVTSSFAHTTQFLAQLINGGTSVFLNPPFLPRKVYKHIAKYNINMMGCVSTHLRILAESMPQAEEVNSLRTVICAGGPTPKELIETVSRLFLNTSFRRGYGLTEAGPRVACSLDNSSMDESSGTLLEGVEVLICNETGKVCRNGESGEILVKSPSSFLHYYKNELDTERSWRNGWLRTGDVGLIDNDNKLYVTGRIKNIIVVGGNTVCAEDVEEVLLSMKCVHNALVFGEKNELSGEMIIAHVVLTVKGSMNSRQLLQICRERLLPYQVPSKIKIVEHIEQTESGKVLRYH